MPQTPEVMPSSSSNEFYTANDKTASHSEQIRPLSWDSMTGDEAPVILSSSSAQSEYLTPHTPASSSLGSMTGKASESDTTLKEGK